MTTQITLRSDENRIIIASDYDVELISVLKSAGCSWNKNEKVWHAPIVLAPKIIKKLEELDQNRFIINRLDEVNKAIEAINKVIEASSAVDVESFDLPDNLNLFNYQKAGVKFILDRGGRALIGDEQGLGKTIEALVSVILLNDRRVIVVCPASVIENWKREAKRWIGIDACAPKKSNEDVTGHDFIVISYDAAKKLKIGQRDCIIIDEAHYIKNTKSQRHKAIVEIADRCKHVIALTGTPLLSRPVELWGIMRAVQGKNAMNFWNYANRFCDAKQTRFGWDFAGASNLDELNQLFRSFAVRRVKSQVLTDLPEKINETVYLYDIVGKSDTEKTIEQLLKRHKNNVNAVLKSLGAEGIKQLWGKVLQEFHENAEIKTKDKMLMEFVVDAVTVKTLVFAKHKNILDQLENSLNEENIKFIRIDGDVDINKRQRLVDDFNNNEDIKVALLSFGAAREGLNMQSASQVIFTEMDWTPGAMSQAEARAHRMGQKNSVLVKTLITTPFDNLLRDVILSKSAVLANSVDGDSLESSDSSIIKRMIEAIAEKLDNNKKL
jgi:SWI/SNF-related matrix-associated actin-dependent regulator 1 of chromatin subfamily A